MSDDSMEMVWSIGLQDKASAEMARLTRLAEQLQARFEAAFKGIGDAYPGEEDIAVSLGAIVAWRNVSDKPSVNPSMCRMNVALTPLHTLSSLFPHRLRRPQGTPKARLDLATECVTPILRQLFRVVVKSSLKQFNCHVK